MDADKPVELRDEFNLTLIVLASNDKIPVFDVQIKFNQKNLKFFCREKTCLFFLTKL